MEALIQRAHKTRTGWRTSCPFCERDGHRDRKTSLSILGDGRWWCYRCSTKGKLRDAPDPNADAQRVIQHTKDGPKVFDPPEYFVELADDDSITFGPARRYLLGRGIDRLTMKRFGIGACYDGRWHGRVIVPIRVEGAGDAWFGWVGRLWTKPNADAQGVSGLKYLYPPEMSRDRLLFNADVMHCSQLKNVPAMLVEGAFDCFPFPAHAFASLGKLGRMQVDMIVENCTRPLAVVLDGDAWREAHAFVLTLRFDSGFDHTVGSVRLPPRTDPDEVDKEELLEACQECLSSEDPVRL